MIEGRTVVYLLHHRAMKLWLEKKDATNKELSSIEKLLCHKITSGGRKQRHSWLEAFLANGGNFQPPAIEHKSYRIASSIWLITTALRSFSCLIVTVRHDFKLCEWVKNVARYTIVASPAPVKSRQQVYFYSNQLQNCGTFIAFSCRKFTVENSLCYAKSLPKRAMV